MLGSVQPAQPAERVGVCSAAAASSPLCLASHLPLSLIATAGVLVLPALLAARLLPPDGLLPTLESSVLAILASLSFAAVEKAVWERRRRGSDLLFADLMLWGLVRRWWVERRLDRLSDSYDRAADTAQVVRVELLEAIARLLEARSPYTYGHCRRVARRAEQIARAMHLTPAEVATIRTAALVHDVGKIYTPPALLEKAEPLGDAERRLLARHSVDGARMLEPVEAPALTAIVRHHHERFSGRGCPDGLIGEEIPLGARIVAVADAFDVFTSRQPGRPRHSQRQAIAMLEAEAGVGLDRRVVETFLECCSVQRSVFSYALLTAVSERLTGALQLPGGLGAATTTGSAAQLLPALGAVGLLALTPAVRHEPRHQLQVSLPAASARVAAATRAQAGSSSPFLLGAASENSPGSPAYRLGGARRRASSAPSEPAPNVPATPRAPSEEQGNRRESSPSEDAEAQSAATTAPGSMTTPVSPPGQEAQAPLKSEQAAPAPPQQQPTITTPVISTPAISTPAIELPPVKLPPLNIPAVTIPPVTIPPITLPGVKLPLGR
jgi:putative nucleotidyltransferase with HDIG domain